MAVLYHSEKSHEGGRAENIFVKIGEKAILSKQIYKINLKNTPILRLYNYIISFSQIILLIFVQLHKST